MQSQSTTPISTVPPDDSPEQLLADLSSDPVTREILLDQLRQEAEDFIASCLQFALLLKHAPDAWAGKRALIDARLWMKEATTRLEKDIAIAAKERKPLPPPGRRGGV